MEKIEQITGGEDCLLIVFDIDEFLTHDDHAELVRKIKRLGGPGAYRVPHVHFWPDDSKIVVGSYADVAHDRAYWWTHGVRYKDNHNHPCLPSGQPLNQYNYRNDPRRLLITAEGSEHPGPCWLHYGFCKSSVNVADKNAYYVNRGEAVDRPQTTEFRAGLLKGELPPGASSIEWRGKIPEVMLCVGEVVA